MNQPTPTPNALAEAERNQRLAKKEFKAAEKYLANAIRDAVALSFKREGDGLDRYDEADLRNIGRLAIKAHMHKARLAMRKADTQSALRAAANPNA
jgi:hypothetical protein